MQNALATGADALVLGDLGCMLSIEGRLRRGATSRPRCHVAMLAGVKSLMKIAVMQSSGVGSSLRRPAGPKPAAGWLSSRAGLIPSRDARAWIEVSPR